MARCAFMASRLDLRAIGEIGFDGAARAARNGLQDLLLHRLRHAMQGPDDDIGRDLVEDGHQRGFGQSAQIVERKELLANEVRVFLVVGSDCLQTFVHELAVHLVHEFRHARVRREVRIPPPVDEKILEK